MKNILYLASSSISRQNLLKKSIINFSILDKNLKFIKEDNIDINLSLEDNVKKIALSKMNQIDLNRDFDNFFDKEIKFTLTADTIGKVENRFLEKPKNYNDAILSLKNLKDKLIVFSTTFVLEKKEYNLKSNSWQLLNKVIKSVTSKCIMSIPDNYIDYYLKNSSALSANGAIEIDGIGLQFLKFIEGSYSAILGLPLFELIEELEKLNFFN